MEKQQIIFEDLGRMDYQEAWDYQENLLQQNLHIKSQDNNPLPAGQVIQVPNRQSGTKNYLLFVEHPPVYTLGKSGHIENLLINEEQMKSRGISFFKTNRGGDITFHGYEQIVGYPILDLEKFGTDLGKYMRRLEEVIIRTLAVYGIKGDRSTGETGVWINPERTGQQRKIAALGVRCSRWITMHGFAFNVNTDLSYFNDIIACGIQHKQVTSLEKELGRKVPIETVKEKLKTNFEMVFDAELVPVNLSAIRRPKAIEQGAKNLLG